MPIINEGLKELHDTITITLLTQLHFGVSSLTSKTSHIPEQISSDRTLMSLQVSALWPTALNTALWPPLSGCTHLVDRRNSQVVRLLGSLNWLMSRSLSKAGVLPSSPRREEKPQEMDRWGQGYTAKSLGKCVLKTKETNTLQYPDSTPLDIPWVYSETQTPIIKNTPMCNKNYKLCFSL